MVHLSIFTIVILCPNFAWSFLHPCFAGLKYYSPKKPSGEPCQPGVYKYYWNDEADKCLLFYDCGNTDTQDLNGNTYGSFFTKEECISQCGRHRKIRQNENDDYDEDDDNLGISNDDDQVNGKMTALEYLRKLIKMGPSESMLMKKYETSLLRNMSKLLKIFQFPIDLGHRMTVHNFQMNSKMMLLIFAISGTHGVVGHVRHTLKYGGMIQSWQIMKFQL